MSTLRALMSSRTNLFSLLLPIWQNTRLSILIYHRVLDRQDPMRPWDIDAFSFRWQITSLARHFNVLPLSEAVQRLRKNSLPKRAVCITFDDGYADNAEIALPILKRAGIPATFFIATNYLNGGRMWNDTVIEALRVIPTEELDLSRMGLGMYSLKSLEDKVTAAQKLLNLLKYQPAAAREEYAGHLASIADSQLPDDLMMSTQQVQTLHAAGMDLGGHTANHPILACLDVKTAQREIVEGKEYLEGLIGERIGLFAYPNGKPGQDYLAEHVEMVRKLGFDAAVTTAWGVSTAQTDRWQLPRFTPWDRTQLRFLLRLFQNYNRRIPETV